jgi:hypothetical protein
MRGKLFGALPLFEIFLLAAIRENIEIMRKTEMAREKEMVREGEITDGVDI